MRECLNYSLLLNQVSQHTTATGRQDEDTSATSHYIRSDQFSSLGRRMLLSIRCQKGRGGGNRLQETVDVQIWWRLNACLHVELLQRAAPPLSAVSGPLISAGFNTDVSTENSLVVDASVKDLNTAGDPVKHNPL